MALLYVCATCKGKFKSDWTDIEAKEEYFANFGYIPSEQPAIVCDDCYKLITGAEEK